MKVGVSIFINFVFSSLLEPVFFVSCLVGHLGSCGIRERKEDIVLVTLNEKKGKWDGSGKFTGVGFMCVTFFL